MQNHVKLVIRSYFREWPDQLKTHVKKERLKNRPCSIIILNWDSRRLLTRCLKLIKKNTKGIPYNILIVDNGSTKDDSVQYLKLLERYCKVSVLYNPKNRGFAPAVNQAIRETTYSDICLLNVDAEPQPRWLEEMYRTLINNPRAGIIGPLGNEVASGHQRVGYITKDDQAPNLHGFCMLIMREVIEDIGYLDEVYPVGGYEDTDYGIRAKMAGYELWMSAKSLVIHRAHQVFRAHDLDPYENELRNREIYLNKFFSALLQIASRVDVYKDESLAKALRLKIP